MCYHICMNLHCFLNLLFMQSWIKASVTVTLYINFCIFYYPAIADLNFLLISGPVMAVKVTLCNCGELLSNSLYFTV